MAYESGPEGRPVVATRGDFPSADGLLPLLCAMLTSCFSQGLHGMAIGDGVKITTPTHPVARFSESESFHLQGFVSLRRNENRFTRLGIGDPMVISGLVEIHVVQRRRCMAIAPVAGLSDRLSHGKACEHARPNGASAATTRLTTHGFHSSQTHSLSWPRASSRESASECPSGSCAAASWHPDWPCARWPAR